MSGGEYEFVHWKVQEFADCFRYRHRTDKNPETLMMHELTKDFSELLRVIDLADSGDTYPNDWHKDFAKFARKWFSDAKCREIGVKKVGKTGKNEVVFETEVKGYGTVDCYARISPPDSEHPDPAVTLLGFGTPGLDQFFAITLKETEELRLVREAVEAWEQ